MTLPITKIFINFEKPIEEIEEDIRNLGATLTGKELISLRLRNTSSKLTTYVIHVINRFASQLTAVYVHAQSGSHEWDEAHITRILNSLPTTTTELTLSINIGQAKPQNKRLNVLKAIPRWITHLNLSHAYFSELAQDDLIVYLQQLPPNLLSVIFWNAYSYRPGFKTSMTELELILRNMPQNPITFQFGVWLYKRTASEVIRVIQEFLPKTIKEFDCSFSIFETFDFSDSLTIISAFPRNLEKISIHSNWLTKFSHDEQLQLLHAIPSDLQSFEILHPSRSEENKNDVLFINKSADEIVEFCNTLPSNVNDIDISVHATGTISTDKLISILQGLRPGFTKINIQNQLRDRTEEEIQMIFSNISRDVVYLDLLGNNFDGYKFFLTLLATSLNKIRMAIEFKRKNLAVIPSHIRTIDAGAMKGIFDVFALRALILTSLVTTRFNPTTSYFYFTNALDLLVSFATVTDFRHIDETGLNYLIRALEILSNNNMNHLACALLLDGTIPTLHGVSPYDFEDARTFRESRLHAALDYHNDGAKNPSLTPLIENCLWQLQTVHGDVGSVSRIFRKIDVAPGGIESSSMLFRNRASVELPKAWLDGDEKLITASATFKNFKR